MTRTRIVATLGPASREAATITALVDAGVDVFRLNFSHGTQAEHGRTIAAIRGVAGDRPIAILQDLGGPKLRLAHPVAGEPGDVVDLALPATVRAGDPVLLADGLMQLEVIDARRSRVLVGGDIPAGKGVNLPSSRLDMPSLTPKDESDLRFGVDAGVDLVALSFVRRASDLDGARAAARGTPIVAKVETAEAVTNLESIVAAADGIMLARGDLGVEIPIARVPVVQKRLIALANRAAKPIITATQMLRSMVESPLPTRAEATDVANAVLDGTDAVMLSEESAVGRYPVEAVHTMGRILAEAEPLLVPRADDGEGDVETAITRAGCRLAREVGAAAIVVLTRSGATARRVARWRPSIPIVALTVDPRVRRQLALVWGVTPIVVPTHPDGPTALGAFRDPVRALGVAPVGAPVVVIAGWPPAATGTTNLVHVTTL